MCKNINKLLYNNNKEYFEDIIIAEHALNELLLTCSVSLAELICDVYCIPSHNHQTFYMKLYQSEKDFIILYAKTFFADFAGFRSTMCSFKNCIDAQKHSASTGQIICGKKILSKSDATIKELISCLPLKTELINYIMLDGENTIIINHLQKQSTILSYSSNANFKLNQYSDNQKFFLNNLYIHIEKFIGNILDYQ